MSELWRNFVLKLIFKIILSLSLSLSLHINVYTFTRHTYKYSLLHTLAHSDTHLRLTLHFFSICSKFATFFVIKAHLVYIYSGSLLIFTTTCGSWKHISTSLAKKQEIVYGDSFMIVAEVNQP